jgi:hypothetical protein
MEKVKKTRMTRSHVAPTLTGPLQGPKQDKLGDPRSEDQAILSLLSS